MVVTPTTTYTLAKIAQTYTEGEGSTKIPLFEIIDGDSGTYTADTDQSGNVWVTWVAPESGVVTFTETDGEVADSYLMIFDSTGPNYTNYSDSLDYDDHNSTTGCTVSTVVEAGKAYVIKLGSYYSRRRR